MENSQSNSAEFHHVSVLAAEVVAALNVRAGGHYLDATAGGGGHSALILSAAPNVRVTAIDQDPTALAAARDRLHTFGDQVQFWQGNFRDYDPGPVRFDGILADLGVSSAQLDTPERGFSLRLTGNLDMRMNPNQALSAAEIVNQWDETELATILFTYGEERLSRRIARRIVDQRPFHTTTELAEAIARCVPASYRYGNIHPATRTFQALRIVVNQELDALEVLLRQAPHWLAPHGRLAIISFHSLEDRLVKHSLRGSRWLRVLTKKPIVPTELEIRANARSRSAKLRVAERLPEPDSD
ncbi:MAG: 16S rRNA (cytosine(1402)-N(4))-methyltransferase RsmH [Cyanobacteria bacterium]|nr:16S rRNA (cytosine(1402)-N(4))-methyltransferase RsmH [Cyanobacteriota bacterium]MDW8199876.1 16S rRNA (cytosine(1402)-N(4))-methyltransferase RsmH [Cyanobacteriota bacterium SKYGB_h_bin112]